MFVCLLVTRFSITLLVKIKKAGQMTMYSRFLRPAWTQKKGTVQIKISFALSTNTWKS